MFPDDDVEVTVEVAFGADLSAAPSTWTFTDLSSRVIDTPITVSPGALIGVPSPKTGSVTGLSLLNDDGHLTPFLPTSPYWPYVDVGTPARLSIRTDTSTWIADSFARTVAGGWGTGTSGAVWSGTTALSVDGSAGLIGITAASTQQQVRTARTHRDVDVRFTASIAAVSTGASNLVGPVLRQNAAADAYIWAGLEFGTGGTVFWTIRTVQASTGTVRQQVTETGLTYSAGTIVSAHVTLVGSRLRARAWVGTEPDGWTADIDLPVLADADDYLGFRAWVVGGNTNALPNPISIDNVTVQQPRYTRFEGYIADVQPSFVSPSDGIVHSTAQIQLGGVGTRLERKDAPAWSPLRRSLQLSATPPTDLWMLEDKAGSTTAASAFDGHKPMVVTGPAVFEFDTGVPTDLFVSKYGTTALCSVAAGAKLSAPVTAGNTGEWTASLLVEQDTALIGGGITEVRLLEWTTPGSVLNRWALVRTMTAWTVRAYNDTANTSTDVATTAETFGTLLMLEAAAVQSGGTITVTIYVDATTEATGSIAGTMAAPQWTTVNPDQVNTTGSVSPIGIRFVVGAVMFHAAAGSWLPYYYDAGTNLLARGDNGWAYEAAHRRAVRLAGEDHIPLRVLGDPYTTGVTLLNAQQPGPFQTLLGTAIDSESGGILYEDAFGYALLDRTGRYNAPVDLTVDMSTYCYSQGTNPDDVLVPKLEARGPNYWTVQRANGSSATYAAPATFRARRGTIAQQATLDVLYDADCPVHASWRTHLNVDGQGANYPSTSLDLVANPALADDWLLCRFGSRLQRTHQPTIAGLGVIDQVIAGWSETFTPRTAGGPGWTATIETSPAAVWQVGAYDTSLLDSASTTLAADVTDSGPVLGLSTSNKLDVWTTTAAPFDVAVAGQTNTVLWMSGVGSISPVEGGFETGVTGWSTVGGSMVRSTAHAHAGAACAQLTVSGSPGSASIFPTAQIPVTALASYTASCWVYAASVPNVRLSISWYTSGGTFISSSASSTITAGAVWTLLTVSGTAPGTAVFARMIPALLSSPANGTALFVDDVDLVADAHTTTGVGPYVQYAWTTRDPTVTKALTAGEPVHVANPAVWAL